jgi:hypothetical protein
MITRVERHSERWLSYEVSHPRERLKILAATANSRYRSITIKEKNGKARPISDPSPELKFVQGTIRERLLLPIPLSLIVYSDVPGRSAVMNAEQHLNQAMFHLSIFGVATVNDERDGFPRFRETLGLHDSSHLLTRLTTLEGTFRRSAPTSGVLRIHPIAVDVAGGHRREPGLVVTRYVDNIDSAYGRAKRFFRDSRASRGIHDRQGGFSLSCSAHCHRATRGRSNRASATRKACESARERR